MSQVAVTLLATGLTFLLGALVSWLTARATSKRENAKAKVDITFQTVQAMKEVNDELRKERAEFIARIDSLERQVRELTAELRKHGLAAPIAINTDPYLAPNP